MKNDSTQEKRLLPKESFSKVLKTPHTPQAVLSPPRMALRSESLAAVRSVMHVEAHRLVSRRNESHATQDEQTIQRVSDLIANEVGREPMAENYLTSRMPSSQPSLATQAIGLESMTKAGLHTLDKTLLYDKKPTANVDSVLAMAEKIEWLMSQSKPALSLTLSGTQGGVVDIEKISGRKIKIRLNRADVFSPEALSQLQEALKAKGLSWVLESSGPGIGIKQ